MKLTKEQRREFWQIIGPLAATVCAVGTLMLAAMYV